MPRNSKFDEALDAIELLPAEQQADLVDIVRRRLAEHARQRMIADARDARAEHQAGNTRPTSVDDIMREIES